MKSPGAEFESDEEDLPVWRRLPIDRHSAMKTGQIKLMAATVILIQRRAVACFEASTLLRLRMAARRQLMSREVVVGMSRRIRRVESIRHLTRFSFKKTLGITLVELLQIGSDLLKYYEQGHMDHLRV